MDINTLYTDLYSKDAANAKTNRLSNSLKQADLKDSTDEELMGVCKQFESYFVEQVLKNAMDTFTEGDEFESSSMSTLSNFYKDQLMTEYSNKITEQNDLGLAQTLYNQMKRNLSPDTIPLKPVEQNVESSDPVESEDKDSE